MIDSAKPQNGMSRWHQGMC